jgi:hypothetical protein
MANPKPPFEHPSDIFSLKADTAKQLCEDANLNVKPPSLANCQKALAEYYLSMSFKGSSEVSASAELMAKLVDVEKNLRSSILEAADFIVNATTGAVENVAELGRSPLAETLGDGGAAWTDVVARGIRKELKAATQAFADVPAQEARKHNLRITRFEAKDGETAESLLQHVRTELLEQKMCLRVELVSATRIRPANMGRATTSGSEARPESVLLKFATAEDRQAVLRARKSLAGTCWGLDEDLTPAQQAEKSSKWPEFKAAKEAGNKGVFFKGGTLYINFKPTGVPV